MDDRYSILQLIPPSDPDATEQIRALAEGLDAERWRLVVAGLLSPRLRERLTQRGILWVHLPIPAHPSPRNYRAAAAQLQRLVAAQSIDLLHCHNVTAAAIGVLAKQVTDRPSAPPVVASLHTTPEGGGSRAWRRWRWRTSLRRMLQRCDAVIVPSQRDRTALTTVSPRAGRQAQVIYPALAPSTSRPYEAGAKRRQVGLHPDAAIVGLVSRLEEMQGAESFLQAAALINAELPNVEFAVIGEGPARTKLENLAHELGLSGACIFLGERRDVRQIIQALNIIVLLSDADKAPLRGLQALAGGLPVIAAETPGLVELFHGMPGAELIAVAEPANLAAAIRKHLQAPPAGEDAEVVVEGRRSITYRDFLVSGVSYDLEEPWSTPPAQHADEPPAMHAMRERYAPERMVAEIESVYRQLLAR